MTATSPQALARKAVRRKQRRLERVAVPAPRVVSPNRKWHRGPAVKMTKAEMYEMLATAAANTRML